MSSVLIVDDHQGFRRLARGMLEAGGFDVVGEAEDGATALAAIDRLHPSVVVLDIQLPDTNGFEVARAMSTRSDTKVVLVSTRAAEDYGDLVSDTPAAGFVAKGDLSAEAVRDLLDGR